MSKNQVLTIGRQCGSGGKEIGQKLAKKLEWNCYDKELLTLAAKESGICHELFEAHDERPTNSFLYNLVVDTYSMGYSSSGFLDMPLNHKVFLAQFDSIKKLANQESCIIVGRCADYALEDYSGLISIFIHASLQSRIQRVKLRHDLSDEKAKDLVLKTDKKRSSYYNYYSNKKWGDAKSYHLAIDSDLLGIDGTVEFLAQLLSRV